MNLFSSAIDRPSTEVQRNLPDCAACENIKSKLVEKAGLPERDALPSAWVLEWGIFPCQGHELSGLRAIADADLSGPGLRRETPTERSECAPTRAPESQKVERLASRVVANGKERRPQGTPTARAGKLSAL